jgi:hypothetical protein
VQYLLLGGTVSLVTCHDLGSTSRALGERWKDKTTHNCNEIANFYLVSRPKVPGIYVCMLLVPTCPMLTIGVSSPCMTVM